MSIYLPYARSVTAFCISSLRTNGPQFRGNCRRGFGQLYRQLSTSQLELRFQNNLGSHFIHCDTRIGTIPPLSRFHLDWFTNHTLGMYMIHTLSMVCRCIACGSSQLACPLGWSQPHTWFEKHASRPGRSSLLTLTYVKLGSMACNHPYRAFCGCGPSRLFRVRQVWETLEAVVSKRGNPLCSYSDLPKETSWGRICCL